MLLFGTTSNAQKVVVDADSLYNVFINFEKVKIERRGLVLDTTYLRGVIGEKDHKIGLMQAQRYNYDSIIIPKYKGIINDMDDLILIKEKKARKNFFKGAGIGAGILAVISFFL